MKTIKSLAYCIGMICTVSGCSHTLIFPDPKVNSPSGSTINQPEWIQGDRQGYFTVIGSVEPVKNKEGAFICSFSASKLFPQQTILTITAAPEGFDSTSIEIPIYSKSISEKDFYFCSNNQNIVRVMPYTVLDSNRTFNGKIRFRFMSDVIKSETVSSYVSFVGNVFGGLTMGGAPIVANLIKPLTDEKLNHINSLYSEVTRSRVINSVPLDLSWSQLSRGVNEIRIPVYVTEVEGSDFGKAIDNKSTGDYLFDVLFKVEYRRSLFTSPSNFEAPKPDMLIYSDAQILKITGNGQSAPTLLQLFNKDSMIFSSLVKKESAACSEAWKVINEFGFSKHDEVIVYRATLNVAYPSWRSDSSFARVCVNSVPVILDTWNSIFGEKDYIPNIFPIDSELSTNSARKSWQIAMANSFINSSRAFRASRTSTELSRHMFSIYLTSNPEVIIHSSSWGGLGKATDRIDALDRLSRIKLFAEGCHIPNDSNALNDVQNDKNGMLFALAEDGKSPFVIHLTAELGGFISKIEVYDADFNDKAKLAQYDFHERSECKKIQSALAGN